MYHIIKLYLVKGIIRKWQSFTFTKLIRVAIKLDSTKKVAFDSHVSQNLENDGVH